jgi:hypothetical protein
MQNGPLSIHSCPDNSRSMVHHWIQHTWTPPAPRTLLYDRDSNPPFNLLSQFLPSQHPTVAWQGSRSSLMIGELQGQSYMRDVGCLCTQSKTGFLSRTV